MSEPEFWTDAWFEKIAYMETSGDFEDLRTVAAAVLEWAADLADTGPVADWDTLVRSLRAKAAEVREGGE